MSNHLVTFQPLGRRIEISSEIDLLTAAQRAGVDMVAACGGLGICGTCLVRVISGELTPISMAEKDEISNEKIEMGYRMACQSRPLSDVSLEIPPESLSVGQKMQVEGQESAFKVEPQVISMEIILSPPALDDLRSDVTRVNQYIESMGYMPLVADVNELSNLSELLRSHEWAVRLALSPKSNETQLIGAFPPGTELLGLAVDMGSTKLAVFLMDLESGALLAQTGVMNPQIAYGEDVVSRIAFANRSKENRKLLQTRLISTINQSASDLCNEINKEPHQIVDAVFVGNTAMHHFFSGLPVAQLGAAPYIAAASDPLDFRASEIGLELAKGAWLHLPANIAGYVGADHTAALISSGFDQAHTTQVLVDIGTNTEISLVFRGSISSCSTASGPAFEGAHIRDGMRAAPGAIERVHYQDGKFNVVTVGGTKPVGICGTGILNAIATMVDEDILDIRGVFNRSASGVRLSEVTSSNTNSPEHRPHPEYVLVPSSESGHDRDIIITRKDVHEIQLAKGAIRAGIEILLFEAGLKAEDVDTWVIAGAFGTYLDLGSALRIGMFPNVPTERFLQVGNAAGVGARQMLLSHQKRTTAKMLANSSKYIELTAYSQFTQKFVDSMYFE
jgi:uncharacterized 2Fe-2S/4Fe-4S cluster protein (DUF4445 family)